MAAFGTEFGTELVIAAVFSLFMVVVVRLKTWQRGEVDDFPGYARVYLTSLFALTALLLSFRIASESARGIAIVLVASFWFAAIYDRTAMVSTAFGRIWAYSLAGCLALWAIYEILLMFGVDLAEVGDRYSQMPAYIG